ncbi:MAG: polysaccharide biosynthesis C-terminal domain-containing protein [Pyrinomonadaceae bacterium]|nr:polysaccharide biosynthesis C-terminal domain-containing protein [Pyrinomonadaceae bacterium]
MKLRRTLSPPRGRFSTHVVWTFAARVLMAVNSVITGIIIARWLGAGGLGVYAVLSVAVANAVQFGGAGLASANVYFIARERQHLAPAALNTLVFSVVTGGALALIVVGLAALKPALFGDIPLGLLAVAVAATPFHLISLLSLNIFLVEGRVDRYVLLDLLGQSFILINAVLVLLVFGAGLRQLVFLNTVTLVVVGIGIAWVMYRYLKKQGVVAAWRLDVGLFRRMMRYGIKYNVLMIATMLVLRADLLIVNVFRGATEAGVYSVASQGALMLLMLPTVIASLLFPRVAAERDAAGKMTCRVTQQTVLVMLIACLAAVPASFALPVLYGASFADSTIQLLILLPGVYLFGLESILVQHFVGTGLPRVILLFWAATVLISIVLNLALVPLFGARGAAVSSTLSYSLIFTLVIVYFRARTGNSFASILLPDMTQVRELIALLRPQNFLSRRV